MIGRESRALRQLYGWSLYDLALASGINKAYLSEWETGKRALAVELIEKIEAAYHTPPAGREHPRLMVSPDGHVRLTFPDDEEGLFVPMVAHIKWLELDGSAGSMFVGERS